MMRLLSAFIAFSLFAMFVFSCKSKETPTTTDEVNEISQDVLSRIAALGFSTEGVKIEPDGYIVENDIFLSKHELEHAAVRQSLVVGESEQYRTTNLVTGLPRVITVSLSSQLSGYSAALDIALARYNAENLQITFQRVTSGAAISIVRGNGSYLASAGFPTSTGAPHNSIRINSNAIGSGTSTTFNNYVATILAHEIGHCIGFRHTDYMNRAYSCGGAVANEGASTVGAIHIPGTPTTADPNSWMLACIGSNQSRPFNANDKTALNFLY
jgi:Dual-action HEIGH metallo-peptidase